MIHRLQIQTKRNHDYIEITQSVRMAVTESGVKSGLCLISSPHTTAALTITSFWDTKVLEDIQEEISRLIPTKINFKHQHDTPQDAAGHIKSSLIGNSTLLIIEDGELFLGHSQGIYFLEFDGPRKREYFVKVIKESE